MSSTPNQWNVQSSHRLILCSYILSDFACGADTWSRIASFYSSSMPSSSVCSRTSLKVTMPLSLLFSSMTTNRCTRDLRIVSYMVDMLSFSEQVKIPGKSCCCQKCAEMEERNGYSRLNASVTHRRPSGSSHRIRRP